MRKKAPSIARLHPTVPGKDVTYACRVHCGWSWSVVQCLGLIGLLIQFVMVVVIWVRSMLAPVGDTKTILTQVSGMSRSTRGVGPSKMPLHETKQLVSLYVLTDVPTFGIFASCHHQRERNRRGLSQMGCPLATTVTVSTSVYDSRRPN